MNFNYKMSTRIW